VLAQSQEVFEYVASYSPGALTLSGAGNSDAELIPGERVSASYFPLLRASAWHGRVFTESEDDPTRPTPVVILGHQL
jgi:hypothetical protein